MTGFVLGAALLVLFTLTVLLLPLFRRAASADFSRQQINAAIYRDELAELENDRSLGALSQTDYEQARNELQRRLLEDSSIEPAAVQAAAPAGRTLPVALALGLPLLAVLIYLLLGNPAAVEPPATGKQITSADIERMVAGLAARLEREPEDLKGWAMLARSYKSMGRFPEAVRAYERAGKLVESSPDMLVDFADTRASQTGSFDARTRQLLELALKLDPAHPEALWLRGTVFFNDQQYGKARDDWELLLKQLPPASENYQIVKANLAEVAERMGKAKDRK